MSCCKPDIYTGNSSLSDIPYTAAMRAIYGPLPKIDVLYLVDGDYVIAGNFTLKQFNGTNILVDHGGIVRWLVKVS